MFHKVKSYSEVLVAALCLVGFGVGCGNNSGSSALTPNNTGPTNTSPTNTNNPPGTSGTTENGSTITVSGSVLDEDGNPVTTEGVLVIDANGARTKAITDKDGKFSVSGVKTPYDLVVIKDAKKTVFIYKGLTKTTPTAFIWTQSDNQTRLADRSATVTGTSSGGDSVFDPTFINFASNEVNQWYDPDAQIGLFAFANANLAHQGAWETVLEWNGPVTTTGRFLELQYRPDPGTTTATHLGLPTAYWYDYQPGFTVLSGQDLKGPNLFLRPTATDTVEGTISTPGKYKILDKFVGLQFQGGINFFAFHEPNGDSNFTYMVPDIAEATTQVCANAADTLFPNNCVINKGPLGNSFTNCALSVTCDAVTNQDGVLPIVIREAPEPVFPGNKAEDIRYDTVFQWKAVGDAKPIHVVKFVPECRTFLSEGEESCEDDVALKFVIITSGNSVTIPNLSDIGYGLLNDTDYLWRVIGIGPFASIDAFATYPVPVPPINMVPPLEAAFPGILIGGHTFGNELAPVADVFWTKSQVYKFGTAGDLATTGPE